MWYICPLGHIGTIIPHTILGRKPERKRGQKHLVYLHSFLITLSCILGTKLCAAHFARNADVIAIAWCFWQQNLVLPLTFPIVCWAEIHHATLQTFWPLHPHQDQVTPGNTTGRSEWRYAWPRLKSDTVTAWETPQAYGCSSKGNTKQQMEDHGTRVLKEHWETHHPAYPCWPPKPLWLGLICGCTSLF